MITEESHQQVKAANTIMWTEAEDRAGLIWPRAFLRKEEKE